MAGTDMLTAGGSEAFLVVVPKHATQLPAVQWARVVGREVNTYGAVEDGILPN